MTTNLNLLNELDAVRAMDGSDRYYKGILTSGGGIAIVWWFHNRFGSC